MIKITELAHKIIEDNGKVNIAVDMTVGKGNDVLKLSKFSNQVYGFDISDEAIKITNEKIVLNKINNITLFKENHTKVIELVKEKIDLAIYNLGYLPGSDKTIKTEKNSTISSLESLLMMLNKNGLIIIVLYPHNEEEIQAVVYLSQNLSSDYDCLKYQVLNRNDCPFIITIKKR